MNRKLTNIKSLWLAVTVLVLFTTACSDKLTPPDTSDIPKSLKYTLEDAMIGRGNARADIATLYYEGELIPKNIEKALYWFELAGDDGDDFAQYNAGVIYSFELDDKDYPDRYDKALYWFKKATDKNDDSEAQVQLAKLYFRHFKKYNEALYWMKKAARTNASGIYNVSAMYNDENTPYYDKKKSFEWLLKAAENGVVNAMFFIGENYFNGETVSKNYSSAYKWVKKSLEESSATSDLDIVEKRTVLLRKIAKKLTPEQIAAVNRELGYKN